jgi:hypothetical protein
MDVIGTVFTAVASAVCSSAATWFVANRQNARQRNTGLGLIRYYLRQLEIQMSIVAKYPWVSLEAGFESVLPRLAEAASSHEGAASLQDDTRERVYDAIRESEQSVAFLRKDDEHLRERDLGDHEYRVAAGRRALKAIYVARAAVHDKGPVKWPSDPYGRHNWRPGTTIQRDPELERAAGLGGRF